jgi:hypothetical protein
MSFIGYTQHLEAICTLITFRKSVKLRVSMKKPNILKWHHHHEHEAHRKSGQLQQNLQPSDGNRHRVHEKDKNELIISTNNKRTIAILK